jgi:hypothetical protein
MRLLIHTYSYTYTHTLTHLGEVLFTKFTETKGHGDIEKPLEKLRGNIDHNNKLAGIGQDFVTSSNAKLTDGTTQSSVGVVSTDAPLMDVKLVKRVFGPFTRTQMDFFHVYRLIFAELYGLPEVR